MSPLQLATEREERRLMAMRAHLQLQGKRQKRRLAAMRAHSQNVTG